MDRYVRGALGEYECVIEDLVAQEGRVFAKMLFRGVHRARFEGFEPTGARVAWSGAALFTIEAGRSRDLWVLGDRFGLQEQLRAAAGA